MKIIFKRLIVLFFIINFIGMIIEGAATGNTGITTKNNSVKKSRMEMIKEKGVLTVAAPPNEIPFFYQDPKTNKIYGIDADIITEVAKRLGINKVEMKAIPFPSLLDRLITDDSIDLAAGGIFIAPGRSEIVSFTQPLYKETESVVVPMFSDINFMNDLKNAVVGVERGTIFVDLAQKWKENKLIKDIVIFESTFDLLNSIINKKVDAGLVDSAAADAYLSRQKLPLRTLKDYTPELPGIIGIAVRKDETDLLKELNEKIDEMKADGTLYSILVEYGLDKLNLITN